MAIIVLNLRNRTAGTQLFGAGISGLMHVHVLLRIVDGDAPSIKNQDSIFESETKKPESVGLFDYLGMHYDAWCRQGCGNKIKWDFTR